MTKEPSRDKTKQNKKASKLEFFAQKVKSVCCQTNGCSKLGSADLLLFAKPPSQSLFAKVV